MKKLYELELTRHGVTPAQFLAYVRQMCKKHEIPFEMSARDFANGHSWGNDVYADTHYTGGTPETRPCFAETYKAKPYDHQTYFRGFDGSVYNEIIEFQFDDEKTGFGYFFTVSTEGETPEDAAAVMRSAVNVHEIAIKRNEYSIEKKGAELAETLRNIERGWAGSYAGIHAEILRHEIEAAKQENEEHRAAIEEPCGDSKAATIISFCFLVQVISTFFISLRSFRAIRRRFFLGALLVYRLAQLRIAFIAEPMLLPAYMRRCLGIAQRCLG